MFGEIKEIPFVLHNQLIRNLMNLNSTKIPDEDWDTLIILDACRYDIFKNSSLNEGVLRRRVSEGSKTSEFLKENFKSKELLDTVYVTANPMHRRINLEEPFYRTVPVWRDHWDNKYGTVLPADVTDQAIKFHKKYPEKRIIVHYNQPHEPFIGKSRTVIQSAIKEVSNSPTAQTFEFFDRKPDMQNSTHWHALKSGIIDKKAMYEAYSENLEAVLPKVIELVDCVKGRVVITSDHGNAFGERGPFGMKVYGHPYRTYMKELVTVPWLEIQGEERRNVTSGDQTEAPRVPETNIDQRLENLGYIS